MNLTRKEQFRVRSYEMDAEGKASVQTICNYLQELAGLHAAELGVSVRVLLEKKLTWILSRLHLIIDKYPGWGDEVSVETWPSGRKGLYATRDFILSDNQDNQIGRATTSWMILDLVRKKPIEMPHFIRELLIPNKVRAIDDPFEKLPRLKKVDFEKPFNVRHSDLDINQHVNNVIYIEWAIEGIPAEIYRTKDLHELEINFRAESRYGERIISQSEVQAEECIHRLSRESDDVSVALVRTRWI